MSVIFLFLQLLKYIPEPVPFFFTSFVIKKLNHYFLLLIF